MLAVIDSSQTAALPFSKLIVIDDPEPHPAALNMALDEVLLAGLGSIPLLRCYHWSQASVSFGCFGNVAAVRENYPGLPLVRRWTGGGIVEHGADFTFTLLVPRALPLAVLPARESYRQVHGAVASALSRHGAGEVESAASVANERARSAGDAPFLKPCFAHPVAHDLIVDGRKVAGGAQRRTRNGLLHQGSIQGVHGIGEPDNAFGRSFRQTLASTLAAVSLIQPVSLTELIAAGEMAVRKYDSPAWTERS